MNHQNDINYQSSSSSYYNSNYESGFQNHDPQFNASAPPDPSIYYSSDYYLNDHPVPDPNPVPSWYNHPVQSSSSGPVQAAVRFDDYGRPITSGEVIENESNENRTVYAYNGGRKNEQLASAMRFDDYGRPVAYGNQTSRNEAAAAAGKATPNEDVGNGVQKFRVTLLSEGSGGDTDVLCQIGLDGIRILDLATSRTLKVYSLETVPKWEVLGSNIFAFWTKSSSDIDAKRVRLKSNSYTTTNILDMVAAASFQLKEMDEVTVSEQSTEKKKGFPDWINLMKPGNEEKDHWVPDEASSKCTTCNTYFGAFVRRHHCRNCGDIFCDKCTQGRIALTAEENAPQVRVCDQCMAEVTQRLSHVNEVGARASGLNRHEDLAKKLQEEMEKKRKVTAGLKSNIPDEKMKEVECPTCTVHLQVEVPGSGSKTIECTVCQHPFLVTTH